MKKIVKLIGGPADGVGVEIEFILGKGWPYLVAVSESGSGKTLFYRLADGGFRFYPAEQAELRAAAGFATASRNISSALKLEEGAEVEAFNPHEITGGHCCVCTKIVTWPVGEKIPVSCPHCGCTGTVETVVDRTKNLDDQSQ